MTDPFRHRRSSSRPTAARAATPARRRTARCSRTPRPARSSPRTAHDRGRDQQRRGVLRADRRAAAGRGARAGRRHRGPDGLQARRRADVGPLEDQAPRHEAAGDRRPAGWRRSARRTPGCRASRTSTPTGSPTRRSTASAAASRVAGDDDPEADSLIEEVETPATAAEPAAPAAGAAPAGAPTTLVLVRHGVTPHTVEKRFSGGLASANPGLSDEGRAQIRARRRLAGAAGRAGRRRRRLARAPHAASRPRSSPSALGHPVEVEPGFAEMEFGVWDGLTFAEVAEKHPDDLDGLARVARRRARGRRVVPGRAEAGARRARPAAGGARRQDRRRGQPRDADQDPGRARRRRAAGGGVPDGAHAGVGHGALVLPRPDDDGASRHASLRLYNALPPGGATRRPRADRSAGDFRPR